MKNIYLIISATSSKLGKFIRLFTNNPYNHVSISFDEDLNDMISFARYYYQIPFYGGYVHESRERYDNSKILLYKITLNEEDYSKVIEYINTIEKISEEYIYHTINAVLGTFHHSIEIPKSHTCISFACEFLKNTSIELPTIYNIQELMVFLDSNKIYEGNLSDFALYSNPSYMQSFTLSEKITKTYLQQRKLIARFMKKDILS